MASSRKRLGELLVDARVIDQMQLQAALGYQRQWGGKLGNVLVERGFISEPKLMETLASQLRVPVVQITKTRVDARALALVPASMAEQLHIFPLELKGVDKAETLIVAMSDPTDLTAIDQLQFRTRKRIQSVLAGDRDIQTAIRRHYHNEDAPAPTDAVAPPPPAAKTNVPHADVYYDSHLLQGESDMVPGLVAWGEGEVKRQQPPVPGAPVYPQQPVVPQQGYYPQGVPNAPYRQPPYQGMVPQAGMVPAGIPPGYPMAHQPQGRPPMLAPQGMPVPPPMQSTIDPFAEMLPDPLHGLDPSDIIQTAPPPDALDFDPLAGTSPDSWVEPIAAPINDHDPLAGYGHHAHDPLGGGDPLSGLDLGTNDAASAGDDIEELDVDVEAIDDGPASAVDAAALGWLTPASDETPEETSWDTPSEAADAAWETQSESGPPAEDPWATPQEEAAAPATWEASTEAAADEVAWDASAEAPVAEGGWETATEAPAAETAWGAPAEAPAEDAWGAPLEGETPAENAWDAPAEAAPAENAWGAPLETPAAEGGWDAVAETPAEDVWGAPAEVPVTEGGWDAATETPAEGEALAETSAANAWETATEAPADAWGTATETPAETAAVEGGWEATPEAPVENAWDAPAETPTEDAWGTAAETPAEDAWETPAEAPAETPAAANAWSAPIQAPVPQPTWEAPIDTSGEASMRWETSPETETEESWNAEAAAVPPSSEWLEPTSHDAAGVEVVEANESGWLEPIADTITMERPGVDAGAFAAPVDPNAPLELATPVEGELHAESATADAWSEDGWETPSEAPPEEPLAWDDAASAEAADEKTAPPDSADAWDEIAAASTAEEGALTEWVAEAEPPLAEAEAEAEAPVEAAATETSPESDWSDVMPGESAPVEVAQENASLDAWAAPAEEAAAPEAAAAETEGWETPAEESAPVNAGWSVSVESPAEAWGAQADSVETEAPVEAAADDSMSWAAPAEEPSAELATGEAIETSAAEWANAEAEVEAPQAEAVEEHAAADWAGAESTEAVAEPVAAEEHAAFAWADAAPEEAVAEAPVEETTIAADDASAFWTNVAEAPVETDPNAPAPEEFYAEAAGTAHSAEEHTGEAIAWAVAEEPAVEVAVEEPAAEAIEEQSTFLEAPDAEPEVVETAPVLEATEAAPAEPADDEWAGFGFVDPPEEEAAPAPIEEAVVEAAPVAEELPVYESEAVEEPAPIETPAPAESHGWQLLGIEQPTPEQAVRTMGVLLELLISKGALNAAELRDALQKAGEQSRS